MSLFFVYEDQIPLGEGYSLFGIEHMIIMLTCVIVISVLVFIYHHLENEKRSVLRKTVACAAVGLIVIRTIYVCICHAELKYELPLHLCSMAGIICFLYELLRNRIPDAIRSILEQTMFSLCLPGAVLAMVFSDGIRYPAIHFITIQSNLYHALVAAYIIMLIAEGDIKPDIRTAYNSIIFLAAVVPVVYIIDRMTGANYMFLLRPSYGSPFTGIYLKYGYTGYMLCYAVTILAEIYLINTIGQYVMRKRK